MNQPRRLPKFSILLSLSIALGLAMLLPSAPAAAQVVSPQMADLQPPPVAGPRQSITDAPGSTGDRTLRDWSIGLYVGAVVSFVGATALAIAALIAALSCPWQALVDAIDHDPSVSACADEPLGISAAVVGVTGLATLSTAVGLGMQARSRDRALSLSLTPGGLSLSGTF